jgi:hypothetical protein
VRRRLGYLLVWTVATTVMVSAAWLGIRSALVATGASRVDPLSAVDLRRAVPPTTATAEPQASATPSPAVSGSPSASPPATDRWIPQPDGHGATAYRRTFRVQGGTVTIVVGPHETKVLDAQAQPGFTVQPAPAGPLGVQVTFTAPEHTSRVLASWRDAPYAEVTESLP